MNKRILISGLVIYALLFNGLAWASNTLSHSFFSHLPDQYSQDQHSHQLKSDQVADTQTKNENGFPADHSDDGAGKDCSHHCHGNAHLVVGLISDFAFLQRSNKEHYKIGVLLTHLSLQQTPPVPPPL